MCSVIGQLPYYCDAADMNNFHNSDGYSAFYVPLPLSQPFAMLCFTPAWRVAIAPAIAYESANNPIA